MTELDHIRRDIESLCLRLDKIEGSESALRGERRSETIARVFELWNESRAALQRAMGELDAANRHVQILEKSRNESISACLRSCAQTIRENKMLHTEAVEYILARALAIQMDFATQQADLAHAAQPEKHPHTSTACQHALHNRCRLVCKFCTSPCMCECHRQPAGGSPTPDLAAQPDSNPEEDFPEPAQLGKALIEQWARETQSRPIGVDDYPSFVSCLRENFKIVFGEDAPFTDPQDMIQRMTAEIQRLRSLYGTV
jgi:hypothetical protein